MPDDFVVARNPEPDSKLPYLLRIPLGTGIILKAREPWPDTSKVYCHRVDEWPVDAEIVERVPTRSCVRRGSAIDLVLDRSRKNRSQLVFTRVRGGRPAIFWQTARTTKQARPGVSIPTARGSGVEDLQIIVDSHERYAYSFKDQQVVTRRAPLPAGDYAVMLDDALLATVERKSFADLVSSLTTGKLKYQLADLAAAPRAAVVVEDRYSQVFKSRHVRPAVVADGLAECQLTWPSVPILFLETRTLAQEWTYRFLAAAWAATAQEHGGELAVRELAPALPLAPPEPTTAEVRAWAVTRGIPVSDRGRIRRDVVEAYRDARFSQMGAGTPHPKTAVRERDSTMPHGDVDTLHNDGKWHNVIEGTDQVSEPFDTLEAAVAEGREMARDLGVEHIVKNLDGTVAERNSFTDEPR